jgi:hypothetical protein
MTTQGRTVRQDTARQGTTTAHYAQHPAGRRRPPGPQPCPQEPDPRSLSVTLIPLRQPQRSGQQRSNVHAAGLTSFLLRWFPRKRYGRGYRGRRDSTPALYAA